MSKTTIYLKKVFQGVMHRGSMRPKLIAANLVLPLPKYSHPEELNEVHNSLGLLVSIFLPRALDPYFCVSRIIS